MHGNTPGRPSKSDPPPLLPPPPPSPPLQRHKKKQTKLDYTDDISIGNPSISSRSLSQSTTSRAPISSKKPPVSALTPPPQTLLDELGTPVATKPKRTFFSPSTPTVRPPPGLVGPALPPWEEHLLLLPLRHLPRRVLSKCSPLFLPLPKQTNRNHNGYNTQVLSYPSPISALMPKHAPVVFYPTAMSTGDPKLFSAPMPPVTKPR